MMITDDGYWYAFHEGDAKILYSFYRYATEIETGEALDLDIMFERFDAFLIRQAR